MTIKSIKGNHFRIESKIIFDAATNEYVTPALSTPSSSADPSEILQELDTPGAGEGASR